MARGLGSDPAVSVDTANNILTELVYVPLQGSDPGSCFTTTKAALTGVTDAFRSKSHSSVHVHDPANGLWHGFSENYFFAVSIYYQALTWEC